MLDLKAYIYQAAFTPTNHPNQHYYRAQDNWHRGHGFPSDAEGNASLSVFRFKDELTVKLTLSHSSYYGETASEISARLSPEAMLHLRDALTDALCDIEVQKGLIERQESLDDLMDEMRDNPDALKNAYFVHPDVHYVAPGEAAAKLEATQGPCIVIEDLEMAGIIAQANAGQPAEMPAPTVAAAKL